MSEPLRVAIIGAGRIGKQHAKWYQAAGCRVVGFLGSRPESLERARQALCETIGGEVPGYTDFEALVAETRPQVASVCSPHPLHCAHTLRAIDAGLHVLCEKPLVWDDAKTPEEMLADARRMIQAAAARGVLLGMNAQYVSAVEPYERWYTQARGGWEAVRRFECVLQSRGRTGGAQFGQIWTDLATHPLSLILKWVPGATLDPAGARCVVRKREVRAEFVCKAQDGSACECLVRTGNVPEGALSRSFGVNGFLVAYQGRNDAAGIFRAYLRQGEEEREYPDFMESYIAHFTAAVQGRAPLPVSAEEGYRNLEMHLELLRRGVVELA